MPDAAPEEFPRFIVPMTDTLYYEDWDATYGSPYLIDEAEAAEGSAELAEPLPAGGFGVDPAGGDQGRVAFVDGVRRGEGLLYRRGSAARLCAGWLAHTRAARHCASPVAGLRSTTWRRVGS